MRHTAVPTAVLLSCILLIPMGAKAQSHSSALSSTTPAWVRHAWEEGSHVLPYAIDVNDENEVYVTKVLQDTAYHEFSGAYRNYDPFVYVQGSFIVGYNADGSLRWQRPGAAPRVTPRFFKAFTGYNIVARDDRIYTNEGTPYLSINRNYVVSHGGVMINTYAENRDWLHTIVLRELPENAQHPPALIQGLGLDRVGNIYVVGTYHADSLFFAPHAQAGFLVNSQTASGRGIPDIFLASYTPEGVIRWTRRIGSPEADFVYLNNFAVDPAGNTYFHGYSYGNAVFGEGQPNETIFVGGVWDSFDFALASFNAEGDLRWVRTRDSLQFSHSRFGIDYVKVGPDRLAVDATGHLLIVWKDLGLSADVSNVYASVITKYSQDGALLWGQKLAAENLHISGIVPDAQGHIYVGGSFSGGTLHLGDTVLRSPDYAQPPEKDGFVAHYDAEGNLRWAGLATGPGVQDITAIAVGPSGDLYVAGKFDRALYLGPEKLEQRGGDLNMFVAKYDAAMIVANETALELPITATLTSNYPNPFAHATTIEYALHASGQVRLSVYDVLGREVSILVDGVQHGGKHASLFDGTSLPSGTYLYRLEATGQVRTGLMTLMK